MKALKHGLGLVFLSLFLCQPGFANVKLNVNAANTALNKITYTVSEKTTTFTLPWKEKALYGPSSSTNTTIAPKITVTTSLDGDLIVKMDLIDVTGNTLNGASFWLKYGTIVDPVLGNENKIVQVVADGDQPAVGTGETVNKTDIKTLCLAKKLAKNSTLTLFDFTADGSVLKIDGPVIFTAILIDDVNATSPQVIGVDVQSVYFNSNWKAFIQSDF